MNPGRPGRRNFLVHCTAWYVATVALPGCASATDEPSRQDVSTNLDALLDGYFSARPSAVSIGATFASQEKADWDDSWLAAQTASTRTAIEQSTTMAGALGMLRARVTEDFLTHRIHVVAGWVLARTEVELCALALRRDCDSPCFENARGVASASARGGHAHPDWRVHNESRSLIRTGTTMGGGSGY